MDFTEEDSDSTFECDVDMAPLIKRHDDDEDVDHYSTKDGGKPEWTVRRVACHTFVMFMAVGLIFTSLLFLPWFTKYMYKAFIDHVIVLDPASPIFNDWAYPPLPVYGRFYFFDIENPKGVVRGERPKVTERGPYVYRMILDRDNITFNDNDTVSFLVRYRYFFDESRSVGPESDTITALNAPLMTTAYMMKDYQFLVRTALNGVLYELDESLTNRHTIREILWGYDEPLFRLAQQFISVPPGFESGQFGFLAGMNDTYAGLFTMYTGKENRSLINSIDRVNGEDRLSFWWSEDANEIRSSTDGSMYHPDIQKDETLRMYQPNLCRSISYNFVSEENFKGVPVLKFGLSPSTFSNSTAFPPNRGFCSGQRDLCGPSGVMRQDPCRFGSPVAISNPHFFGGQQTLIDSIEGLSPNASLHQSYTLVEPKTGMPFMVKFRLQINMFMKPVSGIRDTVKIRETYLPLLWMEQGLELDQETVAQFKMGFVDLWNIVMGIQWLLFGVGVVILLILLGKTAKLLVPSSPDDKKLKKDKNGNDETVCRHEVQSSDTEQEEDPVET